MIVHNDSQNTTFEDAQKIVEQIYRRDKKTWALKIAAALLFGIAAYYAYMTWLPIYTIESVEMSPTIASPGDLITVDYVMSLDKHCERREVTQYLIGEDGQATVIGIHFGTLGKGPTQMGPARTSFHVPTNKLNGQPVQPGRYRYEWVSHALCKPFDHHATFIYPDGYLTIK